MIVCRQMKRDTSTARLSTNPRAKWHSQIEPTTAGVVQIDTETQLALFLFAVEAGRENAEILIRKWKQKPKKKKQDCVIKRMKSKTRRPDRWLLESIDHTVKTLARNVTNIIYHRFAIPPFVTWWNNNHHSLNLALLRRKKIFTAIGVGCLIPANIATLRNSCDLQFWTAPRERNRESAPISASLRH